MAHRPAPLTPQQVAIIVVKTALWTLSPDPYLLIVSLLMRLMFAILLFKLFF